MTIQSQSGNGRVTMALLGRKMDGLADDFQEMKGLLKEECERREKNTDRIVACEKKDIELVGDIQRVNDRIGVWQAAQAILTLVASSVAGWLGVRR